MLKRFKVFLGLVVIFSVFSFAGFEKAEAAKVQFIKPTAGVIPSGRGFGGTRNHKGVDFSDRSMPPVVASASGTVTAVVKSCGTGDSNCGVGYGNYVLIRHDGTNFSTRYAHLDSAYVSLNQKVVQGQIIGKMGNTGSVSGPTGIHLHFEVMESGVH